MIKLFFTDDKFLERGIIYKSNCQQNSCFKNLKTDLKFITLQNGSKILFNHVFIDETVNYIPPFDMTYYINDYIDKRELLSFDTIEEIKFDTILVSQACLVALINQLDSLEGKVFSLTEDDSVVVKLNKDGFIELCETYDSKDLIKGFEHIDFVYDPYKKYGRSYHIGGMGTTMVIENHRHDECSIIITEGSNHTPSQGRTPEHHNRVLAFNKRSKKF